MQIVNIEAKKSEKFLILIHGINTFFLKIESNKNKISINKGNKVAKIKKKEKKPIITGKIPLWDRISENSNKKRKTTKNLKKFVGHFESNTSFLFPWNLQLIE